jgi:hypothetical protein
MDSQPGVIDSLESIPGLLKRVQIRALCRNFRWGLGTRYDNLVPIQILAPVNCSKIPVMMYKTKKREGCKPILNLKKGPYNYYFLFHDMKISNGIIVKTTYHTQMCSQVSFPPF